ncbi:Uncharacterised protein [Streptococcus pneumoniae]|nr:Uncharacterised protein [Streptococcus pneumoniae]
MAIIRNRTCSLKLINGHLTFWTLHFLTSTRILIELATINLNCRIHRGNLGNRPSQASNRFINKLFIQGRQNRGFCDHFPTSILSRRGITQSNFPLIDLTLVLHKLDHACRLANRNRQNTHHIRIQGSTMTNFLGSQNLTQFKNRIMRGHSCFFF